MNAYDLVFWEPCVSPHKVDLIEELTALPAVRTISYIAHEREAPGRAALGWPDVSSRLPNLVIAPDSIRIKEIVATAGHNAIHVFAGIRHFRVLTEGLREVLKAGGRFGLYHEPRVAEGISGKLRLLQSIASERRLREQVRFILAIGQNGPSWFRRVGYPADKIFPFAYFINGENRPTSHQSIERPLTTAYVGRLVGEKGIDLFLRLAERLASAQHRFVIAGNGKKEPLVRSVMESNPYVSFLGALPLPAVASLMNEIDMLVLPSRSSNDGWGVVITEALLSGAYVITNHKVGASIALVNETLGHSASTPNYSTLEQAVIRARNNSTLFTADARQRRQSWAQDRLTAAAGARYLLSILDFIYEGAPAPPPWP